MDQYILYHYLKIIGYNNKNQLIINSRLETINSKLLFKESFLKRKCIVLANGYFEWKSLNNEKLPYFINLPEKELFFLQEFGD